jgi:dolichol-phosphate mannosyltransferase
MVNDSKIDLSIVIPALNEAENLAELIPLIRKMLDLLNINYEILVVDERADDKTRQVLAQNRAYLICPNTNGYGKALWTGLKKAGGNYIVSMDADNSHPPALLAEFWQKRQSADILIASRYVQGGGAEMSPGRFWLSKILNTFFGWGFGVKVRDLSSGYRLYSRKVIHSFDIEADYFEALQEILIKACLLKFTVKEIPFIYRPRIHGVSHARVLKFGMAYLKLFAHLWKLRLKQKLKA